MKVRAAILREMGRSQPFAQSKPLSIEEVELANAGPGEVLIKVAAAGLCHSDLSVINGDRPRPMPMLLGHEVAGVIEEVGLGVNGFKPGDHVVTAFVPSCGHCLPCMSGRPALCEPGAAANAAGTLISGERRIILNDERVNHHLGVSGFAEFAVLSTNSIVRIDESLPLDRAALFGCAVMTGVGAVVNTAQVAMGSTVAVIGLGGVGLNAVMAASMVGAVEVVAIDLQDSKLRLASDLGATSTFNAGSDDVVEAVRDLTHGGVDYAFEMAGSVRAMDVAYRMTRRGGMTVSAGLSNPSHDFSLKHVSLVAEERCIRGSYIGSCVPLRDIPRFIALHQKGLLPVERLMSGEIGLEGINAAFDLLAEGQTVRQILRP
jgi:alcohol dehydrogenase